MSNYLRIDVPENPDDAHEIKQAERELNQAPQDQWNGQNTGVSVNEHGSRETSRVKMSGDDLYVTIPDAQIHPFPDVEAMRQALEHPNYRNSAAYRNFVDRCIQKTDFNGAQ